MENTKYVEAMYLRAHQLTDAGEIIQAKTVLEELLTEEPGYGRAHNLLGWIYFVKFGDYKRASYHLRLAVKFDPDYTQGWQNYANLLLELNRINDLEECATKAIEIEGIDKALIYHRLACAKEIRNDYKLAIKYLKKSKEYGYNKEWVDYIKIEKNRLKSKLNVFKRIAVMF